MKYYTGDGKKSFMITRAIEGSNINENLKKEIIEEYERLTLSAQRLAQVLTLLDEDFNKVKEHVKLIER